MQSILGATYLQDKLVWASPTASAARCPPLLTNFASVNGSVLLLGDSTDRAAVEIFCRLAGSSMQRSADVRPGDLAPFPAQHLTYCRTAGGGTVANDINIGLTGPPYWISKQPSPLRENVTLDALPRQAAMARSLLGGPSPTVIVAHSMAWDYSAWWQHLGHFSKNVSGADWMDASLVEHWAMKVEAYLCAIRRTFPASLLLWRTAPVPWKAFYAGEWWRVPPAGLHAMNGAARRVCAALGVPVLDMATTFAEWRTADGLHPRLAQWPPNAVEKYDETRGERLQQQALWQQILSVMRLAACRAIDPRTSSLASCVHRLGGHGGHTALHARPLHPPSSRPGYCGKRPADVPVRACQQYLRGVASLRECVARCGRCEGCRYATFSARMDDCSLYERCDLDQLAAGHGYVSTGSNVSRNTY